MKVKIQDVCERGASNLKQSDIDKNGEYPVYGAAGYIGKIDFYHQEKTYIAVVKDGAGIGRIALCPAKSSVIGTMQYLLPKDNVLPEYLFYVLKYAHLEKYYTGATIPHIYFKDYRNEEFNLVSLSEQAEIVDVLRKIEGIIESRKQELQKLDDLIKARFVEMFGDTVDNPFGWEKHKLNEYIGFLTSGSRGWAKYFVDDENELFITIKNVKNNHIELNDVQYIVAPDNKEAERTKVKAGDLLISITADLGRTGVVDDEIAKKGAYINQHLSLIRLKQESVNPLYVSYFLETVGGKRQFERKNQNGVKAGLNFEAIKSLEILVPPKYLQEKFLNFVAQVDKSRFVEMPGDIFTGEYKYVIKKLGDVAKVGLRIEFLL